MREESLTNVILDSSYEYHLSRRLSEKRFYLAVKRFTDIIFSLIGIILSFPLVMIFGAAIEMESRGGIFYGQERFGKDGAPFTIYKLRSMYRDAEDGGPKWADRDDSRVTRVGRIIRKARIDEIPQFINILRGDMSLVGPRPERPGFTLEFSSRIPGFLGRLSVRPGLTGLAQVNGGYDILPEEKLRYDIRYINGMSLRLDLKIIVKTISVVLTGCGSR